MLNSVSVFNQVTPEDMMEEQKKDPILRLVCPYVTAGEKLKSLVITKIKSKAVWKYLLQKYLLQFDRLAFKHGVLALLIHQYWCGILSDDLPYYVSSTGA